MANPFDEFDQKSGQSSPFDEFDHPVAQEETPLPEGGAFESVYEPAKAVAGGLVGSVVGGLKGAATALTEGAEAGAEVVEETQSDWAYSPETQAGQKGMETLGDVVSVAEDVLRFPISGLAGLADLIMGKTPDEAAETVRKVQDVGFGQVAGDEVLEKTNSPLLATMAYMSPEIISAVVPVTSMVNRASKTRQKIASGLKAVPAQRDLANQIDSVVNDLRAGNIDPQTASERLAGMIPVISEKSGKGIADRVLDASSDIDSNTPLALEKLDDVVERVGEISPDKQLAEYIEGGVFGIKRNKPAITAIDNGYDQGVVSAVVGATPTDRAKALKMLERMRRGKLDPVWAMNNRPGDVAGDSLLERVTHVRKVNKDAGKELEDALKSIKGRPVDFSPAIERFTDRLAEMGIRLDGNNNPVFSGSDIEGIAPAEAAVKRAINRMKAGELGKMPTAYDLHRLKKYIDENVTYGKAGEGLSGQTERLLKGLRADINDALGESFPEYKAANRKYSDTINALDSLQDSVGKKLDFDADYASGQLGVKLRRLMGNVDSRGRLIDSLDSIERTSVKYGGEYDDSLKFQALFADELDSVFKPIARTSFENLVGRAGERAADMDIKGAAAEGVKGAVKSGYRKVFRKTPEVFNDDAYNAMKELLKQKR